MRAARTYTRPVKLPSWILPAAIAALGPVRAVARLVAKYVDMKREGSGRTDTDEGVAILKKSNMIDCGERNLARRRTPAMRKN